ncbi:hypothetical protein Rleg4DRAFT_6944 [Rhizobium leguminosarum bv. trifolii WSM2297]|uniref:Uncharacterized protein n=1 Tax=Rhizobium leguminosarum bv. trifolii WSM2297 TaxID=754762 RepID=J0WDM6_RHILT|nr:hypothetical protein [Rhizobium leguminosarum]EJC83323.1 hypothetical protein Rleg4DRAFT_5076 [Rhizobium leguminosarum bv. trifolii WSM2297]EJC85082.1 hypothetical protein Rleg4DRAFT_6944 [Rhizobium leguminosarum bv. trifolii WSM2297]
MMMLSIDASHWAILLGTLTLTCWIAAGLAAVLGTNEQIRRGETGRVSGYVTTGLTGAGITSAVAMIALLVFA